MGIDPTAVICQVTIVFLMRYAFYKEIKKQVAGAKTIQTLRHTMALVHETEIKLKKYEGLNDDDFSVIKVSMMPKGDLTVMAIKGPRYTGRKSKPKWKHSQTKLKSKCYLLQMQ